GRCVTQVHRGAGERRETRPQPQVPVADLVGVERQPVVHLGQNAVLLPQHELELLAEDLGVEQVLDPQADAQRLVGVCRPDAALGRAELVLPEVALGHAVELLVVRHDQVRVARHAQPSGVEALALEHVELFDEHRGVDDDAVADHGRHVVVEDPARDELEREHVTVDDDGVPGVVPTLVADDQLALLGEVVGEPALALVTPLGADDYRAGHRGLTTVATAITLTRSYYPAPDESPTRAPRGTPSGRRGIAAFSSRISPMNSFRYDSSVIAVTVKYSRRRPSGSRSRAAAPR